MTANYQVGKFTADENKPTEVNEKDTSTFQHQAFPKPFPAGSEVVVFLQCQSFNGSHTPGIRLANVSNTGFDWRMNSLVVGKPNDPNEALGHGIHTIEDFGWIAYVV